MTADSLFFPMLRRRKQYRTKRDGEHFADYHRYRQEIREDCLGRCVYCDLHEHEFSGQKSMQLDHFRPEVKFPYLANDPHNLVWACGPCNRGKWNRWPALETDDTFVDDEGFIDPFN